MLKQQLSSLLECGLFVSHATLNKVVFSLIFPLFYLVGWYYSDDQTSSLHMLDYKGCGVKICFVLEIFNFAPPFFLFWYIFCRWSCNPNSKTSIILKFPSCCLLSLKNFERSFFKFQIKTLLIHGFIFTMPDSKILFSLNHYFCDELMKWKK